MTGYPVPVEVHVHYGDVVYMQNLSHENKWLVGGRSTNRIRARTLSAYGSNGELQQGIRDFQWTIIRPGLLTARLIQEDTSGCVRYGDRINLALLYTLVDDASNNSIFEESLWLSGSRLAGTVTIRTLNPIVNETERQILVDGPGHYDWIVRADPGNGNVVVVPGHDDDDEEEEGVGQCVAYESIVYLQNNAMDDRWLTGGRGEGNIRVNTYNCYDDPINSNVDCDSGNYKWAFLQNAPGTGDLEPYFSP